MENFTETEPILGNWLEELLASVPQLIDTGEFQQRVKKSFSPNSPTAIGAKAGFSSVNILFNLGS